MNRINELLVLGVWIRKILTILWYSNHMGLTKKREAGKTALR